MLLAACGRGWTAEATLDTHLEEAETPPPLAAHPTFTPSSSEKANSGKQQGLSWPANAVSWKTGVWSPAGASQGGSHPEDADSLER